MYNEIQLYEIFNMTKLRCEECKFLVLYNIISLRIILYMVL